jgi:hypothetical protein
VFWFPVQYLSEIFFNLRRIQRDIIINIHRSSCKVSVNLVRFESKLNFLGRFKKKYSNITFNENPSSGNRVVPCRRTDRQTDMTNLLVDFCNFENAPKVSNPWTGSLTTFWDIRSQTCEVLSRIVSVTGQLPFPQETKSPCISENPPKLIFARLFFNPSLPVSLQRTVL